MKVNPAKAWFKFEISLIVDMWRVSFGFFEVSGTTCELSGNDETMFSLQLLFNAQDESLIDLFSLICNAFDEFEFSMVKISFYIDDILQLLILDGSENDFCGLYYL